MCFRQALEWAVEKELADHNKYRSDCNQDPEERPIPPEPLLEWYFSQSQTGQQIPLGRDDDIGKAISKLIHENRSLLRQTQES